MYKVPASVVSQIMKAYGNRTPSTPMSGVASQSAPSYWGQLPTEQPIFSEDSGVDVNSTPYNSEEIANATPMTDEDKQGLSTFLNLAGSFVGMYPGVGLLGNAAGLLGNLGGQAVKGDLSLQNAGKTIATAAGTYGLNKAIGPVLGQAGYKAGGTAGGLLGNQIQSTASKWGISQLMNALFGSDKGPSNTINNVGPYADDYAFPADEKTYNWSSNLPSEEGFNMVGNIPTTDIGPFSGEYGMPFSEQTYNWTNSLQQPGEDFNMVTNPSTVNEAASEGNQNNGGMVTNALGESMSSDAYNAGFQAPGTYAGQEFVDMLNSPGEGGGEGGDGGTVICTELRRQGFLTNSLYLRESAYGDTLSYETMEGYRAWATPIVRLMRKSELLTKIIYFFARPVLQEMAHRTSTFYSPSLIGSVALFMALPVCNVIGHLKNTKDAKYAH